MYWQAAGLKQWVIQRYGAGSPSHTDHCIPARLPQEKQKYKYTLNTNTEPIQNMQKSLLAAVLKLPNQSLCVMEATQCLKLTSGFSEFPAMFYCSSSQ